MGKHYLTAWFPPRIEAIKAFYSHQHPTSNIHIFYKIQYRSTSKTRTATILQATARRLIQYVGGTKLTDLPISWQAPVDQVLSQQEKDDPRIKLAEIRGSQPHASRDDPEDKQDVISVRLLGEARERIATIHIHEDASSKKVTWR
ncbi:hypothetical protein FQN54_005532 [Arachnomyces sp. PD_36]|nr:hypothetical protein FQN54_005532 [Arachnomyces sp. PD_36]